MNFDRKEIQQHLSYCKDHPEDSYSTDFVAKVLEDIEELYNKQINNLLEV